MSELHILAIEPYFGGSHRAMLDSWAATSRHQWTIFGLEPHDWKWRMRHAPVTCAAMVREAVDKAQSWDILFCSDMLALAEFRGLAPRHVRDLPAVVYFHENQLTYPVRHEDERDLHFGLTNMTTALAAESVWFNSDFHRNEFLDALEKLLRRMPDYRPLDAIETIRQRSMIQYPGIDPPPPRPPRKDGPMRIVVAARWEFDKNPDDLLRALVILEEEEVPFRLSLLGEQFRERPTALATILARFGGRIDHSGFLPERSDYLNVLSEADVFVSTAIHEFFGIAAVEAMAAGAWPLLPNRLAYPELLSPLDEDARHYLYGGYPEELARRLIAISEKINTGDLWQNINQTPAQCMQRFHWPQRAREMDDAIVSINEIAQRQ